MSNKGILIVVSGPSGSGKGTLLQGLMQGNERIKYSVSATTRSPREGEVNGKNYFFVTREEFQQQIQSGGMLEFATYCGNYYGTPRRYVYDNLEAGYDVILEIDVAGATKLMEQGEPAVYIFIMPPSMQELKKRLVGRNTETNEVIEKRLNAAREEIAAAGRYNYIVVNDVIDDAIDKLKAIILCQKCKTVNMKYMIKEVLTDA
ncbi:guanylate kinase [Acetanaerobacterium elongatum]|uniref:Guanylate kinase n=1 Tax=Acetanaerobacterium elongatum TaxID=258515 RepID=A0A1G9VNS6_9FIRM|nr:guanylate kinase [Acetanaerobacterium elongatum]SDM73829.1 guanylate kinase [Acetanaerobacterium elongatum]